MSSADGVRSAAGEPARSWAGRNRAAKVSAFFASGGVAFLGNFATGIAWINPAVFVGLAALCALIAIPAGHAGRFQGRRLYGEGRGLALVSILTGWLTLIVCLLATLAFLGLAAGLAVLLDSA
ncbi:DUF4190 domain-containing protein [Streptomyces capitiformicae]|uniref:DUF4190 domain-containing protein n=1 Tax=Streptomyces capitiformicae TaxID=2014920 RepID=A0A918ZUF9_9ACTN|nr:DUF4190 domain-containing protein [Streptomyces capitiformicae]GHE71079.1 hypothetical protein GCM10017771_95010 [Streptomyces capitiformicae]